MRVGGKKGVSEGSGFCGMKGNEGMESSGWVVMGGVDT